MFGPSSVPLWTAIAALAGVGQVALLTITAVFVYRYLKETERLRIAAQQQVEAAFRPAVVALPGPNISEPPRLENIGNGPAIDVEWSLRNSSLRGVVPFLEPHKPPYPIDMGGVKPLYQAAGTGATSTIECKYRSLSGMQHLSTNVYDINRDRFSTTFSVAKWRTFSTQVLPRPSIPLRFNCDAEHAALGLPVRSRAWMRAGGEGPVPKWEFRHSVRSAAFSRKSCQDPQSSRFRASG